MSVTSKKFSELDASQVIRKAANIEDGTLAVGGFVSAKVGHRIQCIQASSTVEQYEYYDGDTLLYILEIEYNNSDHDLLVRAERIE